MDINTKKRGRSLIVKIVGDIDHHASEEIRDKTEKEFSRSNAKDIIFDFEGVDFMDSSGIGMIIGRYKWLKKSGGNVFISNISNDCDKIFELSGLKKIIPCFDSNEAAVEAAENYTKRQNPDTQPERLLRGGAE